MALTEADRVAETTTTTGTGSLTLGGATLGNRTFATAYPGGGNTEVYYAAQHDSNDEWEDGIGTFLGATNKVQRDKPLNSSAGGSKVNFSAGSKTVYVTRISETTMVLRARRPADVVMELRAAAAQSGYLLAAYNASGGAAFKINSVGGINFGSRTADAPGDATKHISLWGNTYWITVTPSALNIGSGGKIAFYANQGETLVGEATGTGWTIPTGITFTANTGLTANGISVGTAFANVIHASGGVYLAASGGNNVGFKTAGPSGDNDAVVEPAGPDATFFNTVMTRQKGDGRYATVSSRRYKDDLAPAGRAPGFLDAALYWWTWGGELHPEDPKRGRRGYGFVVEDFVEILPEAVAYDDEGRPDRFNAGPLIGALLAEIQHLSSRVAALEESHHDG